MSRLVSFVGAGNLAWHLAPALDNAGYSVREVFSRNKKHAASLVERLYEAEIKKSLDFSASTSTIFILAVSDSAIEEVAREIILPEEAILLHTSGNQPLSKLGYAATSNTAVFYPLQTFQKGSKIAFETVPIFIESERDDVKRELVNMGKALSKQVHVIDWEQRKALQVVAVFASHFSNHMLHVAHAIAERNNLDFDWLKPLVAETLNKSLSHGSEEAQSGPARIGNFEVLDKHMEFLQDNSELANLYRVVSQHIVDNYLEPDE